jgi:hypothetical protein
MGRLVARVVGVGVALAMAVAGLVGCGGGGSSGADGPTATVPTVPPDPFAVPPVIDEAYVNRVLAGLDQADGDVVRLVVATKTIPLEAIDRLKTLYVEDALLQFQVDLLQDALFVNFSGLKIPPGDTKTTVAKLISVRPTCIFAEVLSDAGDVAIRPNPDLNRQWFGIVPLDPDKQRLEYNRTSWAFIYKGFQRNLSAPSDPCVDH